MSIIECNQLTRSYGRVKALQNIDLIIKENTITGLIGRNGAGKTTLLKILAGYWKETSGDIKVFGEHPFDNLFVSANTIFIDDQMNFPTSLTLGEVLEQASYFYEKWDMEFAERLFRYFSFHKKQFHQHLSKGKKSTFNMIIGLASRCALTMFDEPTTGMDTAVRKDFYRALLKDYLAHPRTIILSSHHLDEVEDLLEDVLLIDQGKKYLHQSIDDLRGYAIGLTGKTAVIEQWIARKDILFKNSVGNDYSYVVMKNESSTIDQAKKLGFEISQVAPSDLSVYLTQASKGGIDDVFNKSEFNK